MRQALVHQSFLNENPGFEPSSNERLEFLGDAVLSFVVSDHLYRAFPLAAEGELTAMRVALVRAESLARAARRLELGEYLYLGRGEEAGGGRTRPSLLAAAFEALLAAIFLDRGVEAAGKFLRRNLAAELENLSLQDSLKDPKSRLQELTQSCWQLTPSYHTLSALGPDHAKRFTVEARLGDKGLAQGEGHTKQEAEQEAARLALAKLSAEAERLP